MSDDDQTEHDDQPLENAGEIIERFGGIRPMASKMNVPVTTVQGWKKRDVIPGNRRAQVYAAAAENGIALDEAVPASPNAEGREDKAADRKDSALPVFTPAPAAAAPGTPPPSYVTEEMMRKAITKAERRARNAAAATTGLFAVLLVGSALVLLWPTAKNMDEAVDQNSQRLAEIEEGQGGGWQAMLPENLRDQYNSLRGEAEALRGQVEDMSAMARDMQQGVLAGDAGTLSERVAFLEERLSQIEGAEGLHNMVQRVQALEQSMNGQQQLDQAFSELQSMMVEMNGDMGQLEARLAATQETADSALGNTLNGVSQEDLKAAAMLIVFSQFRDTLRREGDFSGDLAVLQRLVGEDDPELQAALLRLAPHAEEGVLTPAGLGDELKGLSGDIVFASLKGEDVSIKEKAQARLAGMFEVKKDGELVGGTATQETVARAQALLDQGDVQGAIETLHTLEGPAAQAAQPVIGDAQVTLLAQQVEKLLGRNILEKAQSLAQGGLSGGPEALSGLEGLQDAVPQVIETLTPGQPDVVRDPESGTVILPRQTSPLENLQNQFKGLSGMGQPAQPGQPIMLPSEESQQAPAAEPQVQPQSSPTEPGPQGAQE